MILIPLRSRFISSRRLPFTLALQCQGFSSASKAVSTTPFLKNIGQPRSFRTAQIEEMNKFLATANLVLIPKRCFGRGKKVPIFGHATVRPKMFPNLDSYLWVFITTVLVAAFLDWPYLRERYGIYIPYVTEMFSAVSLQTPVHQARPGAREEETNPSSLAMIYEEDKTKIHEVMKEEAKKRYNEEVRAMAA